MSSSSDSLPLPYGWIQEFDPNTNHPFWVDTKADPPRAIWTHPYEDEQYLREHPDVREKAESLVREQQTKDTKPRRHSFNGHDSANMVPDNDAAAPDSSTSKKGKEKRGFFGKLKDKAIGTKEEREAYKREMARVERERQRRYAEMVKAQRTQQFDQRVYAGPSYAPRYGPPAGNPYGYGPGYGGGYGYGYDYGYGYPGGSSRGGSSALPLLGALAGGLLLGDIISGF